VTGGRTLAGNSSKKKRGEKGCKWWGEREKLQIRTTIVKASKKITKDPITEEEAELLLSGCRGEMVAKKKTVVLKERE